MAAEANLDDQRHAFIVGRRDDDAVKVRVAAIKKVSRRGRMRSGSRRGRIHVEAAVGQVIRSALRCRA
jgi:hypothetical protein